MVGRRPPISRTLPLHLLPQWRFFVAAIVVTAVIPLMIHMRLTKNNNTSNAHAKAILPSPSKKQPTTKNYIQNTIQAAKKAEQEILDFFQGESRALHDGIPHDFSSSKLKERLLHRMYSCHTNKPNTHHCTLKMVYIGSGQTTGRDNFFNATYPFGTRKLLEKTVQAAGLELQLYNYAFDSDLSREGPQKFHMCIANLVGEHVDVIAWDFDGNLQASPPKQIEAFLRWAVLQQPALIVLQREGPHGLSRRGKKRIIVNIGPGHDATVYEDDPNDIPEPRQSESYKESNEFQQRWQKGRNKFWEPLLEQYASVVDIATVDPGGSIFHLDHLLEFSNMAFDRGKALPLIDCGPAHPPPCDQVPDFVQRHLERDNLSIENIPKDDDIGGAFCMSMLGCRHLWYGGKKSHETRAALNAWPILRALRDAATELQHNKNPRANHEETSLVTMKSLPDPEYCSPKFCSSTPYCITSYVPNLGMDLGDFITTTDNKVRPRKGATHFADDPDFQVRNLDVRFDPLGYIDRKYAYLLAVNDDTKKKKNKGLDASTTTIVFSTAGEGPLVLCEPPCFIDECSKHRMRPLTEHVVLELDDQTLDVAKVPKPVEVGGPFCSVISESVSKGNHTLRITTSVFSPQHVMISHLIPFY